MAGAGGSVPMGNNPTNSGAESAAVSKTKLRNLLDAQGF
jgi:hypothetical protein